MEVERYTKDGFNLHREKQVCQVEKSENFSAFKADKELLPNLYQEMDPEVSGDKTLYETQTDQEASVTN